MGNEEGCISRKCERCGAELKESDKECPKCGSTKKMFAVIVGGTLTPRGSLRVRHKVKGFGKFAKEIIQGWFPSKNSKLSQGVEKERIVDKKNDKYDEIVRDARTGQIMHETHKPLSQHKHLPRGGS
jgi:hypothetical protein